MTLPAHSLWPLGLALSVAALLLGVLVEGLTLGLVGGLTAVGCMLAWGWDRQDAILP